MEEISYWECSTVVLEPGVSKNVILFSRGSHRFAVAIEAIIEIIHVVKERKVPLSPPSVTGIISVRDKIYPIVDLAVLLDLDKVKTNEDDARMILVQVDGEAFALCADRVEALTSFQASEWRAMDTDKNSSSSKYIHGAIQPSGYGEADLLALDAIMSDLKSEAKRLAAT